MARTWPTVSEFYNMLFGAGLISARPPQGVQAPDVLDYQGALDAAKDDFERDTTIKPFLADGSEAQLQYLQFSGSPAGGTVKLSYGGAAETGTIAPTATAAQVQAELATIAALTAKVTVTGDAGGPYTVVLDSSLYPYSWIVLNTNSLTGGSSPSMVVDEPPEYQDSPRSSLLTLRDYWFSLRSVTTGRIAGAGGTEMTRVTQFDYRYRQGTKAIEALNFGVGFGWWLGASGNAVQLIGRRGFTDDLPANVKKAVMAKAALHPDMMPLFAAVKSGGLRSWKEGDVQEQTGSAGMFGDFATSLETVYCNTVDEYRRIRGAGTS